MEDEAARIEAVPTGFALWWLGALALAFLAALPLGRYDNATQLTPSDSGILAISFVLAGVLAMASVAICLVWSRGHIVARLVIAFVGYGVGGFLATFLFLSAAGNIMEQRRLFPPETSQTYWALLPIERAYRTRKGAYIQPAPVWANIKIRPSDYRAMLPGRPSRSGFNEPKNVSSRSHFCARVQMQQSGEALRVLHAGRTTLPRRSVGVCSQMAAREPSLRLIR